MGQQPYIQWRQQQKQQQRHQPAYEAAALGTVDAAAVAATTAADEAAARGHASRGRDAQIVQPIHLEERPSATNDCRNQASCS